MDEREYLTIDEAASHLGRSVPTVWRRIKRFSLQTFRRPVDRRSYVRRLPPVVFVEPLRVQLAFGETPEDGEREITRIRRRYVGEAVAR